MHICFRFGGISTNLWSTLFLIFHGSMPFQGFQLFKNAKKGGTTHRIKIIIQPLFFICFLMDMDPLSRHPIFCKMPLTNTPLLHTDYTDWAKIQPRYSCPRDSCLSASWVHNYRNPWNPSNITTLSYRRV